MKYQMQDPTSNVLRMANKFLKNGYNIIHEIIQFWVINKDTSTNQNSQSSVTINIENLLAQCKINKTSKMYTTAFQILIEYYYFIKYNSDGINSNHINTIGQVLNCIINDESRIPTENDFHNMANKMNNHTSNVLMKASEFLTNNHAIISEIIQFWVYYRTNLNDELLPEWSTEYDDLINYCMNNKKRDKKWYLIAYHNLSIYHKKIMTNKTSIFRLLSLIEGLFKCMVKKSLSKSLDESHKYTSNLDDDKILHKNAIHIQNQLTIGSKFQHESQLDDAKILHMNVIMNDWLYLRFHRYTHLYENISSVT